MTVAQRPVTRATPCIHCGWYPCRCARALEDRPGWRKLREPCVCGGPDIVSVTQLPHDIADAVQRHQIEPQHIAYDLEHGIPLSRAQLHAGAG